MPPPPTSQQAQSVAKNLVRGVLQRFSALMVAGELHHCVRCPPPPLTFISILLLLVPTFHPFPRLFLFHFFSSVSAITSICYLLLPLLSLLVTHFSSLPSLSWVSLWGGGGAPLSEKFSRPPYPLIFHQPLSNIPCTHTHLLQSIHAPPPTPPLLLPSARPWHKCICSIPPANRLVGCYQRQEEGDNGFHHIFSLPQIKMGQVIRHTQTHTPAFTVTNTHTHTHNILNTLTQVKQKEFTPTQQQNDCNFAFFSAPGLSLLPLDFLANLLSQASAKRYKVKSLPIRCPIVLALASADKQPHTHTHTCQNQRIH